MYSTSPLSRPYINRDSEEFARKSLSSSTSFNTSCNSTTSTTTYSECHSRRMSATSIDNNKSKRRKSDGGGGGPIYCLSENWVLYSLWDTQLLREFKKCEIEPESTLLSPRTRFQCRITSERKSTFLNLVFKRINSYLRDFPKDYGKNADARIFALDLFDMGDWIKGTEVYTPAKFSARELGLRYGGGIPKETLLFGGYLSLALCEHPSKNFDDLLIVLPAKELGISAAGIGVNLRDHHDLQGGNVTLIRICASPQLEENFYPEISLMEKITPLLITPKFSDMKKDRFKYTIVTLNGKSKRELSKPCEFFGKHHYSSVSRSMINEGEEEDEKYFQLPLSGHKDPLNIYLIMAPKLNTTFVKNVDTTKEFLDKSDFSEDDYSELFEKSRDEMVPIFAKKPTAINRSKSVHFKEPNVIEVASKESSLARTMVFAFIFLFLICALIIGSCFFCSGNNCSDSSH